MKILGKLDISSVIYQVPRSPPSGSGKKILKGFFIYEHGDHLGHVNKIICIKFSYLIIRRLHMNFKLSSIGLMVSEKTIFQYILCTLNLANVLYG